MIHAYQQGRYRTCMTLLSVIHRMKDAAEAHDVRLAIRKAKDAGYIKRSQEDNLVSITDLQEILNREGLGVDYERGPGGSWLPMLWDKNDPSRARINEWPTFTEYTKVDAALRALRETGYDVSSSTARSTRKGRF